MCGVYKKETIQNIYICLKEMPGMQVLAGCAMTLQLDGDRADILKLVQTKMGRIAPNLSAVVGTAIAAQLMGVAGGLQALSQMPACNIQVIRAEPGLVPCVQPHSWLQFLHCMSLH